MRDSLELEDVENAVVQIEEEETIKAIASNFQPD